MKTPKLRSSQIMSLITILTMGAGQSTSPASPPSRGLHVLRVTPQSPASKTDIEPFFDFVVGFEGDSFSSDNAINASELEKIVESHEGYVLNLVVWSSKSQQMRGKLDLLSSCHIDSVEKSCQSFPLVHGLCNKVTI